MKSRRQRDKDGSKGTTGRKWLRVVWRGREEVPCRELKYDDGTVRWYGSGYTTFTASNNCIILRTRWHRVCGVVRWVASREVREAGIVALRKLNQDIDTRAARGVTVEETEAYPLMLEYLTHDKYDDGSSRETSVLIVVCDNAGWRICLTDKDNNRTLWKAGTSLPEALGSIELALMADDPTEWRKSAAAAGSKKKRS